MKIKALEYFVALAEARSINEAAQKLYIAQPSLTKSLQLLEQELGVKLFIRNRAGLTLTEDGAKILPEAKQVLTYYNGWLALSRQRPLEHVDIYIQYSFPNFIVPDVVFEFKKRHPEVQINCESSSCPEKYLSQDTERPVLALFVCGKDNPAGKYTKLQGNMPKVLFHGEYCCLVNKNSRLAGKNKVTPEDLKEHFLALKSRIEAPAAVFAPILEELVPVVTPAHVIQMDSVESIIRKVQADPEIYALSYYPVLKRYKGVAEGELKYVPFEGNYTKGDFCLFYSKNACQQYPELLELVKAIQNTAQQFLLSTNAIPQFEVDSLG